jgi:YD repeat-containing protein
MKSALLALVLAASPALAQSRTYYDASGRTAGRSVTDSAGSTTFYGADGRVSARSSTSGSGTTTVYDAKGRAIGRIPITAPK